MPTKPNQTQVVFTKAQEPCVDHFMYHTRLNCPPAVQHGPKRKQSAKKKGKCTMLCSCCRYWVASSWSHLNPSPVQEHAVKIRTRMPVLIS